jgi:hypothetical protein
MRFGTLILVLAVVFAFLALTVPSREKHEEKVAAAMREEFAREAPALDALSRSIGAATGVDAADRAIAMIVRQMQCETRAFVVSTCRFEEDTVSIGAAGVVFTRGPFRRLLD